MAFQRPAPGGIASGIPAGRRLFSACRRQCTIPIRCRPSGQSPDIPSENSSLHSRAFRIPEPHGGRCVPPGTEKSHTSADRFSRKRRFARVLPSHRPRRRRIERPDPDPPPICKHTVSDWQTYRYPHFLSMRTTLGAGSENMTMAAIPPLRKPSPQKQYKGFQPENQAVSVKLFCSVPGRMMRNLGMTQLL